MTDLKDTQDENKLQRVGNSKILLYKKLQAGTGIVIATFTALHLGNHFFMHFGYDAHDYIFQRARKVYTSPIAEATLLSSISVHAVIGIIRYNGRPKDWPRYLFQMAGWFLLASMPGHIFATRAYGSSINMEKFDVTFATLSARLLPFLFIPYYMTLAASGAYHMFLGLPKAGAVLDIPELKKIPQRGRAFTISSGLVTAAAISSALAVMGIYFAIPMAEERLLFDNARDSFPRALLSIIKFPQNGEWFSTIRFPGSS